MKPTQIAKKFPMIVDQKTATNDELVLSHIRMVVAHVGSTYGANHPLYDDLIQVGNMALVRAANTFDRELNISFYSYAIHYVKNSTMEYVINNRYAFKTIVTKPMRKSMFNMKHYTIDGKTDIDRMSQELGIDTKYIENTISAMQTKMVSINQSYEDIEMELPDYASDPVNVLINLEEESLMEKINLAIKDLSEREQSVMRSRLKDNPVTYREIGCQHGVSIQRIQQIEQNAIKKLKKVLTT